MSLLKNLSLDERMTTVLASYHIASCMGCFYETMKHSSSFQSFTALPSIISFGWKRVWEQHEGEYIFTMLIFRVCFHAFK